MMYIQTLRLRKILLFLEIKNFRVRFKWSNVCTEAVLKMLKEMLPTNSLPKTLRTLEQKLLEHTSIEVKIKYLKINKSIF